MIKAYQTFETKSGDWMVRQFLSDQDFQLTPEEYAARNGHLWACFSLDQYSYENKEVEQWIRRVGQILATPQELDRIRKQLLSDGEVARIVSQENEPL